MSKPPEQVGDTMRSTRFARNWAFIRRRLGRIGRRRVASRAWQPATPIVLYAAVVLTLAIVVALTIDAAAIEWASGLDGPVRRFFKTITRYGQSVWLLQVSFVVCLILFCADWTRTSRLRAAAWSEVGFIAAFLFFSIAASGILLNIVKQFIGRSRPALLHLEGPISFHPFMFDYIYQGFPSGHAQVVGAAAITAILVSRRYAVVVLLPCLLIAASRVVVNAHYPSDVLAGLAFGGGFAWLYAVALARAGVGFEFRDRRMVVARSSAIRKAGLPGMLSGLRSALFGDA
ncbi:MAG: phosphatase PAP2 family protein [Bauldia sp.]